jgi:serine/threonine protein kinase
MQVSSKIEHLPRALLDYISVAPNPRATIYSNWQQAQSATADDKQKTRRNTMQALGELRILREVLVMLLLNHPNIAKLQEFAISDHHWYLFFEYVSGGQMLDYIIARGRLKEHVARKFVRGLVSALDYCHRSSVVHRDLKIENVLVSKSGRVKVIDFGLSNLYSPDTLLKTFCGSLYFAAPELLTSKDYIGPELDVWSLGVIIYVLMVGRVPFDSTSMTELQSKIRAGQVEYPSYLSPDCKHLLSRLLVVDPQQRASMYEIRHHVWITKDFRTPPDDCVPARIPLSSLRPEELDVGVLSNMRGFGYGSKPDDILRNLLEEITEKVTSGGEAQAIAGIVIPKGQGLADSVGQSIYWLVKEKMDREVWENNSLSRSISSVTSRSLSPIESTRGDAFAPQLMPLFVPPLAVSRAHSLPLPNYQGPLNLAAVEGSEISPNFEDTQGTIPRIVVPDDDSLESDSEGDPDLAWSTMGSLSVNMGEASKPHTLQRSKSATATFPSMVDERFQNPQSPYQAARGEDRTSRSRLKESGLSKALKRLSIKSTSPVGPLIPSSPTLSHSRSGSNGSGGTSPTMSPQFGQTLTVPGHPRITSDASTVVVLSDSETPRADQGIKTVSLKGLFSVSNTTGLSPEEIRLRLISSMNACNVAFQETWGGFDLDWTSVRRSVGNVLEVVVASPLASPNAPRSDYFDLPVSRMPSQGSISRSVSVSSQTSQPISRAASQTMVADKSVKFEVRIVKLPWMPGGKTHGVVFHRIRGDGLQYRQICARMLELLKL